jgi:hypothetical protein
VGFTSFLEENIAERRAKTVIYIPLLSIFYDYSSVILRRDTIGGIEGSSATILAEGSFPSVEKSLLEGAGFIGAEVGLS